jgi:hypothetical protein
MAYLIADLGVTGLNAYGVLYDLDANTVYNRDTAAWEAFNAANWDDYDWPMTEQGSTGRYVSDDPLPTLTPPLLDVVVRNRTDVAPDPDVSVDPQYGSGWCGWLGTKFAGEGNVRLADGVVHGGSTAKVRLGSAGGGDPPLYVTQAGPDIAAVKFEKTATSATGTTQSVFSVVGAAGVGLYVSGGTEGISVTGATGLRVVGSSNSGVSVTGQVSGISATGNTTAGLNLSGAQYGVLSQGGTSGGHYAGATNGVTMVGGTADLNADITGDLAGKVLGGGSGTITGIGASTQLAAGVLHGGPSTQLELQSSGFTPAFYIHTDDSPAVPALHVEYAGTTAGMTGSAFRISANAAAVGLFVSGGEADILADITGNLSGSVGSVATDGITAASLATDAVTEIATGWGSRVVATSPSFGPVTADQLLSGEYLADWTQDSTGTTLTLKTIAGATSQVVSLGRLDNEIGPVGGGTGA